MSFPLSGQVTGADCHAPRGELSRRWRMLAGSWLAILMAIAALSGCWGDDRGEPVVTGVAAVGAPIANATVTLRDAAGRTAVTTTDDTGTYLFRTTGMTGPFVLQLRGGRVRGQPNLIDYYSAAWDRGLFNITPFTDLVIANLSRNANALFFAAFGTPGSADQVRLVNSVDGGRAHAAAVQILSGVVSGVDWRLFRNFLTDGFVATPANEYDAALERLAAAIAGNAAAWATLLAQSGAASTSPVAATASTGAALVASDSLPPSGNGTLVATAVTSENAGGPLTDSTRVRVTGTVGTEVFEIQLYYKTATATVFNVSYSWGASAASLGNVSFVSAAEGGAVPGVTVNTSSGVASLTNVVLNGASNFLATLNGTINFGVTGGSAATGPIAGTWNLAITGTVAGATVNQAISNVPLGDIPANQNAFRTTGATLADSLTLALGNSGTVTVSNLNTAYTANVTGVIGDTITGSYSATYTFSAPVGDPPPIAVSLSYTYTRVK